MDTRGRNAVRGAPTRASHALLSSPYFLLSTPSTLQWAYTENIRAGGAYGAARQKCRAGRAHARQPSTLPYFLLPTLYLPNSYFCAKSVQRVSSIFSSSGPSTWTVTTASFARESAMTERGDAVIVLTVPSGVTTLAVPV